MDINPYDLSQMGGIWRKPSNVAGQCESQRKRIAELEDENAALRKDKALLDWMFADCIDRKVYVSDYDEETGK